jgi:hypothetical protein
MASVFISYAREDKDFVQRLCAVLKQRNKDTWVDLEGILPSAEWRQEIVAAIEGADAVVQVISPHSVGSKSCSDELTWAVKNNKRIIPILYKEVDEDKLPESVRDRQWVFLQDSDDFNAGGASLVTALDTNIEWVSARTRLVMPSSSVRTEKPATAVATQRKARRRENAGRSCQIAFHQGIHSDIGPARCCCCWTTWVSRESLWRR